MTEQTYQNAPLQPANTETAQSVEEPLNTSAELPADASQTATAPSGENGGQNTNQTAAPFDKQDVDDTATVQGDSLADANAEISADTATSTDTDGSRLGLGVVVVIIAVAVVLLLIWKRVATLKHDLTRLREEIGKDSSHEKDKDANSNVLQSTINDLSGRLHNVESELQTLKQRQEMLVPKAPLSEGTSHTERHATSCPSIRTMYATLQSPGESGILRFAERGMSEVPDADKFFILELNERTGIGTYKVNPLATSIILGDLQMFKDFVKPFSFAGDSQKASISNAKAGRIKKSGDYWIVEEPLDVIIK